MFYCKYFEIFKNIYFEEHLQTTASNNIKQYSYDDGIVTAPTLLEAIEAPVPQQRIRVKYAII